MMMFVTLYEDAVILLDQKVTCRPMTINLLLYVVLHSA